MGSYRTGIRSAVRVSTAGPSGRFGPQRELAPSGSVDEVAVGPGGAAIVAWSELVADGDAPLGLTAVVRPAGASRFGAPEAISPRERALFAAAAFDPRTMQPVVAWVGGDGEAAALHVAERAG